MKKHPVGTHLAVKLVHYPGVVFHAKVVSTLEGVRQLGINPYAYHVEAVEPYPYFIRDARENRRHIYESEVLGVWGEYHLLQAVNPDEGV